MADSNITVLLQLTDNASIQLNQFNTNINNAARNARTSVNNIAESFDRLKNQMLGAFATKEIFSFVDSIQQMENKLRATTNSTAEFEQSFRNVKEISDQVGQSMTSVGDLYSKVAGNATALHMTLNDAAVVTQSFANALKASGASAEGSRSAIEQFGQILNKGKADGDEMRTVLENLSSKTIAALAKQLGMTTPEFLKMRTEGKLTAELLARAFMGASEQFAEIAAKMPTTLGQALNQIKNSFIELVHNIESSTGIFSTIAGAMQFLAQHIQGVVVAVAAMAAAWATMKLIGWLPIIGQVTTAIKGIATAFREAGVAAAIMQAVSSAGLKAVASIAVAGAAAIAANAAFDKAAQSADKFTTSMKDAGQAAEDSFAQMAWAKREAEIQAELDLQTKAAESFVKSLKDQAVGYELTGVAKLRAEAASLKLNDAQKKEVDATLAGMQVKEDEKKAEQEREKAKNKAASAAESAANRIANAQEKELTSIDKLITGYDMMSDSSQRRFEIEHGNLSKLSEAQKQNILDQQNLADQYTKTTERIQASYDAQIGVANASSRITEQTKEAAKYYDDLTSKGKDYADIMQSARAAVASLTNQQTELAAQITVTQKTVDDLVAAQARGETVNAGTLDKYQQQLHTLQLQKTVIDGIVGNKSYQENLDAMTEQLKKRQEINVETKMYNDLVAQPKAELKEINDEMAILEEYHKKNIIAAEQYDAELGKLQERRFKAMGSQLSGFEQAMVKVAKGMESSMSTFFFDVMQGNITSLADSFKKMLDQMVADYLASVVAQELFGGFASKNVSTRGVAAAGGTGLLGGLLSGIFKASGGAVSTGSPYIVGEIGPELFVPKTSGTIIPANVTAALGAAGSGSSNTLHVNVTAMDSQDVLRAMDKIKRPLAQMMSGTNRTYNLGGR